MSMPIRSLVLRSIAIASFTAFIAGCGDHQSSSSNIDPNPSHSCTGNPYLMKYNCSLPAIQSAAENGNPDAQYALGYMYYYGIDTVQDRQTAQLWIQRAAAQGQPLAQKALNLMNGGGSFTDLHAAAANQQATQSNAASTIQQQDDTDVNQLNAQTPTQPITNYLPAYKGDVTTGTSADTNVGGAAATPNANTNAASPSSSNQTPSPMQNLSMKKAKVHDPRLSPNAKPIVASNADQATANAPENTVKTAQKYTVQLMASNQLSDVKDFIAAHNLQGSAKYYETQRNGQPWYMLTYGQFNTEKQAEKALNNLPNNVKKQGAWVKSDSTMQAEVQEQKIIS